MKWDVHFKFIVRFIAKTDMWVRVTQHIITNLTLRFYIGMITKTRLIGPMMIHQILELFLKVYASGAMQ